MKAPDQLKLFSLVFAALLVCQMAKDGFAADKIRVAYSALAPTQGVLWVAEVGGLFTKNGLNADLVYTRAAIETLVAGEVHFGQMTGALMFSARLQGADPVMLAGVQDILNDRLIVRPGINSVEELKGKRIGQAQISERHANFIVNLGAARADEVRQLMDLARAEVQRRFGVELASEVKYLGDWPDRGDGK